MRIIHHIHRIPTFIVAFIITTTTVVSSISPIVSAQAPGSEEDKLRTKQDAAWVDTSGVSACGAGNGTNIPNGTPDENAQEIFNFLTGKGLTAIQAAGVMGNLQHESGYMPQRKQGTGIDDVTPAVQVVNAGANVGWGLVQFTPPGKFIKYSEPDYMQATAQPPYESANSLGTQLNFVWEQLEGRTHIPEGQALKDLKTTTTLEQAVLAFQGGPQQTVNGQVIGPYRGYERPLNQTASVPQRVENARTALTKYGSITGGDSSGPAIISAPTQSCSAGDLTAMTYNVLGASHSNDGGISPERRINYVVETVKAEAPNIIGFQEVSGFRDDLKNKLGDTYDGFPQDGDGEKDGASRPIYWNKNEWTSVREETFEAPRYDNRNAKFPWVELKHTSGAILFVANIHTSANGYHTPGYTPAEARKVETQKMIDTLKDVAPPGAAIITLGDYNSTCEEEPCKMMQAAGYSDAGLVAKAAGTAENYEYNTSHGTAGSKRDKRGSGTGRHIDHVFVSSAISVVSWKNVVMTEAVINGSDHTPVVAKLSTGIGTGVNGWTWPVLENIRHGNCFGVNVGNLGAHAGMDINSTVKGNIAVGAHSGVVVASGNGAYSGNYVIVKTNDAKPLYYGYQHLETRFVKVGDKVTPKTTKIGIIGHTGRVFDAPLGHLHFTVATFQGLGSYGNLNGMKDPMDYLPKDAPDGYKCDKV